MHYRLSCRHFHATHTSVPTDTACVSIQIQKYFVSYILFHLWNRAGRNEKYFWMTSVGIYIFLKQNCCTMAFFVCLMDTTNYELYISETSYTFLLTGCAQVRVSVLPIAESRLSSPGSWFIAPSQAHKWTNTKLEWNERINQSL